MIAIVIPCYNRLDTLKNLLRSLLRAHYRCEVDLVFSIDNSGNDIIVNYAKDFEWKYGKKEIIHHKENIGLRRNIISCGDLTRKYEAVIILEDDQLVSPFFFEYAYRANEFYKDDEKIAGISLYSYRTSESFHEFNPISNGFDTYFMQWTSSRGQLWTRKQWESFKEWYVLHCENISEMPIPEYVKTWPHSWKKFHIAYLVDTNKYFVYPTVSYTTIQPSLGVHASEVRLDKGEIVPLCSDFNRELVFQSFEGALVYDCFFEIKQLNIDYNGQEITCELNLYGDKKKENITKDFFISSKIIPGVEVLKKWGILEIPLEMNILNGHEGVGLYLYKSDSFSSVSLTPREKINFRIQLTVKERLQYYVCKLPALFK